RRDGALPIRWQRTSHTSSIHASRSIVFGVATKSTKKAWARPRGRIEGDRMLRITCPYCGERDQVEYVYAGNAKLRLPELSDFDLDRWTDWVFIRDNPMGEHHEYWQHAH